MDEGADEAGGRGGAGTPYAGLPVAWEHTGDGEFPYRATVDGAELVVRVNDFPAEPLYSLLVNGRTAVDLEDWPERWRRPAARRPPRYTEFGWDRPDKSGAIVAKARYTSEPGQVTLSNSDGKYRVSLFP